MDDAIIPKEVWIDITGFIGAYQVSSHGRVRSLPRTLHDGRNLSGRIKKTFPTGEYGHMWVDLYSEGIREKRAVHRIVLEAFVGPCPVGMQCRHLDGKPHNNTLKNLKWGTPKENCADKIRHGTDNRGTNHVDSMLTDSDISEIRKLKAPQDEIAKQFNVSQSLISRIKNRRRWSHI